ncbi:hypothetical protein GCM10025868_37370 [Angustibacter aerolatus]|uniref:Methylated-DNA-[protein]-cysteine S-methyltransferase DNA binding domain-containing protein n=1 Tax=Angustibacter aerolatus TaxID=1162965 RepID=A0ABQ6JNT6_9ACTN|nr:MGMT family protein [Angustibacter aerolatus]GMA88487.1 hypothetical protein GCM10025868_37370 [Angustibacter aerolatus]
MAEYLGTSSPRGVGSVMARHGAATSWWRVLRADGSVVPDLRERAMEHYRREGTPLRGTRVDLSRARWDGR